MQGDADLIDVSDLASLFPDPAALMAALAYDSGETTFSFEMDAGAR